MTHKTHYETSFTQLVGKTVQSVRHLNTEEIKLMCWDWENPEDTTCIEFTDGTYAVIMSDPEGNGSGFMCVDNYDTLRKELV